MTYSIIGILASLILLINNRDILWGARGLTPVQRNYRLFLMGVMAYYVTDLRERLQKAPVLYRPRLLRL